MRAKHSICMHQASRSCALALSSSVYFKKAGLWFGARFIFLRVLRVDCGQRTRLYTVQACLGSLLCPRSVG